LAWLGILAVGSLGEQIKTRLEVKREQESTKEVQSARTITLPSGVQYVDKKIGGGPAPYKGALVALNLRSLLHSFLFSNFTEDHSKTPATSSRIPSRAGSKSSWSSAADRSAKPSVLD